MNPDHRAELEAIMHPVLLADHIETRDPEGMCLCACTEVFNSADAHMQHAISHMMAALEQAGFGTTDKPWPL